MDGLTPAALVAAIRAEGGFDASSSNQSDATLLGWANAARAEALATAQFRKARVNIGPTVAGQAEYALPVNVVDLQSVRVGTSRRYGRIGSGDYDDLVAGETRLARGVAGAFAPDFEADADAMVALFPTPAEGGLDVWCLAVVLPASMALGDSAASVGIPAELQRPIIVHGAVAEGKLGIEEDDQAYGRHRQIWTDGRDELKKRGNSRIGRGATQIRIG